MNYFEDKSDFITTDPRKDRQIRYNINADFMQKRHTALLPPEMVEGKSVLDIGCCVGATGGWVLEHGARYYVGVDINPDLCNLASANIEKYYGGNHWDVINLSFEEYFEKHGSDEFDIVFISGTLYAGFDWLNLLKNLATAGKQVVIETFHPNIAAYTDDENGSFVKFLKDHPAIMDKLENTAAFTYMKEIFMYSDSGQNTLLNYGAAPSMGALKMHMERLGYKSDTTCNDLLKETIPEWYHNMARFGIHFNRVGNINTDYLTVKELYENPEKHKERLQAW